MMGEPGTGKSTVLNILRDLLDGMIVNRSSF
jgi:dephospho-CoA kinase